jgi:predicted phosphodiesterase
MAPVPEIGKSEIGTMIGNCMTLPKPRSLLLTACVACLLLTAVVGFTQGRRGGAGQGRGGQPQPAVFYTDVPAHPLDIVLARPTGTTMTLSILAYKDMEGTISYGTPKGSYPLKIGIIKLRKGEPSEVVLSTLDPNTQYSYRLNCREPGSTDFAPGEECSFYTARSAGSTFTFTVQADPHLDENSSPEVYARTLANALAGRPDFHIDLGDTFMTDKYRPNYQDAFKQYLAQRYYFGLLCKSAPLFFVLGNHDGEAGWQDNGTDNSVSVWSNRMRKKFFPNPVPDAFYTGNKAGGKYTGLLEDYYAWEWGDALFVVLDPFWYTRSRPNQGDDGWNWTLGAEQYRWLKQTLEHSRARFKFIFIHHLVGGATREARGGIEAAKYFEWGGYNREGNYAFKEKRPGWDLPIHPLLVQNKVSIVFHGHDHLFVKQDLDGIVYQLVPQPGSRRNDNTRSAQEYGYVHGDVMSAPGFMRITVSQSKVTAEYVRTYLAADEREGRRNGQVAHSYSIGDRGRTTQSSAGAGDRGRTQCR